VLSSCNETSCAENRNVFVLRKKQSINVKLFQRLVKNYSVKVIWGSEAIAHIVSILTLDEGEWSASRLSRFTSGQRLRWEYKTGSQLPKTFGKGERLYWKPKSITDCST
jgi:hypothetical protein